MNTMARKALSPATVLSATTALLLTALAAAQPALAAEKRPDKPIIDELAPDLYRTGEKRRNEKPVSLLEPLRDHIVLLIFFRTDDALSLEALDAVGKAYEKFGDQGVAFVGITDEKKEKIEEYRKGKELPMTVYPETNAYIAYDVTALPRVFMIDTESILRAQFHPLDNMEERIRRQMENTPPPGADPKALQDRLAEAAKLLVAKEVGRAYTIAMSVKHVAPTGSPLSQSADKVIEQIVKAAEELLDDAHKAERADKIDEAVKILTTLSVRFGEHEVAQKAANEISRMMGDREVKAKLKNELENQEGFVIYDKAKQREENRRYVEALELYDRVVLNYEDTEVAKLADAAIDRINDDPLARDAIRKWRDEQQANRWLDIADGYAKVRMFKHARKYYEQLLEEYPTSKAAPLARERMKDLPEEVSLADPDRDKD
jgi:tetratricopeptide (TPR) repeat protein